MEQHCTILFPLEPSRAFDRYDRDIPDSTLTTYSLFAAPAIAHYRVYNAASKTGDHAIGSHWPCEWRRGALPLE
jgi:hypothetical protein